jgi:hypothetical protein
VDTLIAIGQAVGLGAACGLNALVPGLVAAVALAVDIPYLDTDVDDADHAAVIAALGVTAGLGIAFSHRIPARALIALRTLAGGVLAWVAGGDEAMGVAVAGAAAALVVAIVAVRLTSRAGRAGSPAIASGLAGTGSLIAGALALVPVVGYLLAVAGVPLALRARSRDDERHAGLRILR